MAAPQLDVPGSEVQPTPQEMIKSVSYKLHLGKKGQDSMFFH